MARRRGYRPMHLSHPDVPLPEPIMEREPVRVPVWVASFVAGLCGLAVDLLMGGEWRIALAGFIATVPVILFGAEVARGRAWSPASVWQATVAARRDERNQAELDRPIRLGSSVTVTPPTVTVYPPDDPDPGPTEA